MNSKREISIRDLIDVALRSYNFDETITRQQVVAAYRHVVGEFIVSLTRSVFFDTRSHTLKVLLSVSALKQELSYKTTDLINAINKQLGSNVVHQIVFL